MTTKADRELLGELLKAVRRLEELVTAPPRARTIARYDYEEVDPVPIAVPIEQQQPPSVDEMIQQAVRQQLSAAADEGGYETFEEADDFEEEEPDEIPWTAFNVNEEYDMEDEVPPLPVDQGDPSSPSRPGGSGASQAPDLNPVETEAEASPENT